MSRPNTGSLCRAEITSKAGLPNTLPYLPIDEQFNETKTNGFLGDELRAALSLLPSLLPSVLHHDKDHFASFHDVDAMFTEVEGGERSPVVSSDDVLSAVDFKAVICGRGVHCLCMLILYCSVAMLGWHVQCQG